MTDLLSGSQLQHFKSVIFVAVAFAFGLSLIIMSSNSSNNIVSNSSDILMSISDIKSDMKATKTMLSERVSKSTLKPHMIFILADDLAYQNLGNGISNYEGESDRNTNM